MSNNTIGQRPQASSQPIHRPVDDYRGASLKDKATVNKAVAAELGKSEAGKKLLDNANKAAADFKRAPTDANFVKAHKAFAALHQREIRVLGDLAGGKLPDSKNWSKGLKDLASNTIQAFSTGGGGKGKLAGDAMLSVSGNLVRPDEKLGQTSEAYDKQFAKNSAQLRD